MANKAGVTDLGPYVLRVQSDSLLSPNDVASEIRNFVQTPEGTLRSVVGPAVLMYNYTPTSSRTIAPAWSRSGDTQDDGTIPPFGDSETYDPNDSEPDTSGGPSGGAGESGPDVDVAGPDGLGAGESESGPSGTAPWPPSHLSATPSRPNASGTATEHGPTVKYSTRMHGIYHAILRDGDRDVLLLHTGKELWEFEGWNRAWRRLVVPTGVDVPPAAISQDMPDTSYPKFPTQFESTPRGIVIVPQDARALYYDGRIIAPLGFSEVPGTPQPKGPSNRLGAVTEKGRGINDTGYAHDGTPWDAANDKYMAGATRGFGGGRVGTLNELTMDASVFTGTSGSSASTKPVFAAGWVQRSEYRCRTQYVDVFGNLSASSPPSAAVEISFQPSEIPDNNVVSVDKLRKQIAWTSISTGPRHCIGRNLYRTKDMVGSGDQSYYRHTQNTTGMMSEYATLTDNMTTIYPDNVADQFLTRVMEDIDPVPQFKLCRMAFGRLWIANTTKDPGMVRASKPGRFGTFPSSDILSPDPSGGEITGLASTANGLLVFTATSSFLISPAQSGFNTSTISTAVGCAAPSSIATLEDGRVMWLGKDAFYVWDGTALAPISNEIREYFRQLTPSRKLQAVAYFDPKSKEYRCWVSTNASRTNNVCMVFNGQGWAVRTDTETEAVCVTQDHRSLTLTAGKPGESNVNYTGVYVLDSPGNANDADVQSMIDAREALIETAWMQSTIPLVRHTARVVNLWLRESEDSQVTVEVLRDWRNTVIETVTVDKYSSANPPAFYKDTALGQSGVQFARRAPYWTRAQVYVPSSETFKFRIKGTGDWEFLGLQIETVTRNYGGAQVPP